MLCYYNSNISDKCKKQRLLETETVAGQSIILNKKQTNMDKKTISSLVQSIQEVLSKDRGRFAAEEIEDLEAVLDLLRKLEKAETIPKSDGLKLIQFFLKFFLEAGLHELIKHFMN